jgi:hypothetical protein
MSLTYIDTGHLPKEGSTGHGEVVEVLSNALCGARNVHGSVRSLRSGETFAPETILKHQLIYLMEGDGRIRLDGRNYDVGKGAGVYLGPSETAHFEATVGASLKIFHLIVSTIPE